MSDAAGRIADNLARVQARMARASERSGRPADSVKLVAVTKYVPVEIARVLVQAGCVTFGESRPQELWSKAAEFADLPIEWHLVGHLQRNKIRRTLPLVTLIHSVDSPRLLAALDAEAAAVGQPAAVLLEVNISGEEAKTGLAPETVEPVLLAAAKLPFVSVRGLMGMAGLAEGATAARRDFAALRQLRDQMARAVPREISLAELSMGMSDDFEGAIEEGATIVRVGSALFEGLDA
jgi:pyridoxal phosphate enzyme (YggS family)